MMILLSGHSLTARNRFMPERMQLQLSERQSTATLTLSDSAPTITVGDWMQSEDGPAKGIVWRVRSVDSQIDTQTRTVQLEHAINTLKDLLIFGEVKPGDISGNEKVNPLASATARYILARQSDWVLGAVEKDRTNPYGFNGDSLYNALETVSSSMTECVWEYDFSRYPFVLNMRAINNSVATEMRTDRNIRTLRKTVDRSRMYTRHYPIGKEDLHLSTEYVGKNENLYGVICKTETDQSLDTEEALRLWATERLNRHCEPIVTVTISGLDLSEATGEPLDKLTLNRVCRVPLPEYDTTISERIAKLSYNDAINDPMNVTVTLANELPDVASIIRNDQKAAAGGGRGAAKKAGEDHAWFVDTDEHVGMVAEAVAGPGADKDWSRVSSIFADGTGLHAKVTYAEGEAIKAQAGIEIAEKQIEQFVEAVGEDGKITAASICLAINDAGSQARINADHIILSGRTSINDVMRVGSNYVTITTPLRVNGYVQTPSIDLRSGGSGISLTDTDLATTIKKAEVSGNTLTLTPYRGDPINFSKAISSWNMGWSNGNLTVKANPQDQTCSSNIYQGTPVWDGREVTIPILAVNSSNPMLEVSTGRNVVATYPEPSWSYGNLNESNSQPSGSAHGYQLDTRYAYHSFYITVGGESKLIVCRTS